MSEKQRNTTLRFAIVFGIIVIGFLVVMIKIIAIQTIEREQWMRIAESQVKTNQPIAATRGNILDCKGRLMASSLPKYTVRFDPRVEALHQGGDTLFYRNIDSIAEGFSRIIGDRSADEYKRAFIKVFRENKKIRRIVTKVSYTQRKELMQLPLIRRGVYKSGITFEDIHERIQPFTPLASRTIGSIYGESGRGITGLEKRFDSELSGKNGLSTRQRIGGRWENVTVVEAEDGMDVVMTIDADIQDIVETTLKNRMESIGGEWGCCILMETKSGKIRAIANLTAGSNGNFYEGENNAVKRFEPGSTFKTIALIAALDDGKVDIEDTIRVTKDSWKYKGLTHTDAHPRDTVYNVRSALAASSNIALAKIITHSYEGSAHKFVRRIEKMGLLDSLYCEVPGAEKVLIPVPKDTATLSKMSYGYSVELSPIQTLMFYNAIANDGKMIRPYMVERIEQNGEVVKRFGTETINSSICKSSTLKDIRSALHEVVWDNHLGTASVRWWNGHIADYKAQSELVHIAGKTGTAQIRTNRGYQSRAHRISFVGYFPEEDPQYTCICMINHPTTYGYDAGYDCGGVVRQIAEKVIAKEGHYVISPEGQIELKIEN